MGSIVRKFLVVVETTRREMGRDLAPPTRKAAALAVIENPFAGRHAPDLEELMQIGEELGGVLGEQAVAALGVAPAAIESYGKAAIVGEAGELEHGALWHAPGGYAMREVLGGAKAIVPSTKKVGGPGARLDVPVTHINASYVRSHFDAMEIGINDAPRRDELVLALVMTTGARVHARAGGLEASQIKGEDGLR
jgi:hypothetical protein